jgi:hypothetical protein
VAASELFEADNAVQQIVFAVDDLNASVVYAHLGELEEVRFVYLDVANSSSFSDLAPHQTFESCQRDLVGTCSILLSSVKSFQSGTY